MGERGVCRKGGFAAMSDGTLGPRYVKETRSRMVYGNHQRLPAKTRRSGENMSQTRQLQGERGDYTKKKTGDDGNLQDVPMTGHFRAAAKRILGVFSRDVRDTALGKECLPKNAEKRTPGMPNKREKKGKEANFFRERQQQRIREKGR